MWSQAKARTCMSVLWAFLLTSCNSAELVSRQADSSNAAPFSVEKLCAGPDIIDAVVDPINVHQTTFNILQIAKDGSLRYWNRPITMREFEDNLMQFGENYYGVLLLRPHPETPCETVQSVRRIIAKHLDCSYECAEGPEWDFITESHAADI